MTHDTTPPTRIWADQDNLTWVEEFPGEAMMACEAPYILASEAEAMVAAALRGAAHVDWTAGRDVADTAPEYLNDWQRGLVAGQSAFRDAILALIPQSASAALDKLIAEAVKAERERMMTWCAKRRETFCLASPGSDEEIHAWLAGFDAAATAIGGRK